MNLRRPLVIWLLLMVIAILNGGLRQIFLEPHFGEKTGHVLSTLILSALICIVTKISLSWMRIESTRMAWQVGFFWLSCALAFEFLAGHYLFGLPWQKLIADYDVSQGRIWILVILTILLAPVLLQKLPQARSRP